MHRFQCKPSENSVWSLSLQEESVNGWNVLTTPQCLQSIAMKTYFEGRAEEPPRILGHWPWWQRILGAGVQQHSPSHRFLSPVLEASTARSSLACFHVWNGSKTTIQNYCIYPQTKANQ